MDSLIWSYSTLAFSPRPSPIARCKGTHRLQDSWTNTGVAQVYRSTLPTLHNLPTYLHCYTGVGYVPLYPKYALGGMGAHDGAAKSLLADAICSDLGKPQSRSHGSIETTLPSDSTGVGVTAPLSCSSHSGGSKLARQSHLASATRTGLHRRSQASHPCLAFAPQVDLASPALSWALQPPNPGLIRRWEKCNKSNQGCSLLHGAERDEAIWEFRDGGFASLGLGGCATRRRRR